MNEVMLNRKNKDAEVTWHKLEPGQLAEIAMCEVPQYIGKIVQRRDITGVSVIEVGSDNYWDTNIPDTMRFRPLEPGESVTITVK